MASLNDCRLNVFRGNDLSENDRLPSFTSNLFLSKHLYKTFFLTDAVTEKARVFSRLVVHLRVRPEALP